MSQDYLHSFSQYEGPLIQVNTRVPEGLDRIIEIIANPNYGIKNKAEFTRISVVHLDVALFGIKMTFQDDETLMTKQNKANEMINKALSNCYAEGKNVDSVLDDVQNLLKKQGYL